MSYQEKRVVVATVSGLLIFIGYCTYGLSKYFAVGTSLLDDLHFWATAMLTTIIVGILAMIVIQIIFHIFLAVANEVSKEVAKEISKKTGVNHTEKSNEKFEIMEKEDEMDKLITLKAMKISSIVVGISFIAALVSLYLKMPPAVMLNIIFLSFAISTLIEGFSQLYFYKNGIKND